MKAKVGVYLRQGVISFWVKTPSFLAFAGWRDEERREFPFIDESEASVAPIKKYVEELALRFAPVEYSADCDVEQIFTRLGIEAEFLRWRLHIEKDPGVISQTWARYTLWIQKQMDQGEAWYPKAHQEVDVKKGRQISQDELQRFARTIEQMFRRYPTLCLSPAAKKFISKNGIVFPGNLDTHPIAA